MSKYTFDILTQRNDITNSNFSIKVKKVDKMFENYFSTGYFNKKKILIDNLSKNKTSENKAYTLRNLAD